MGRGLISENVGNDSAISQFGNDVGAIAHQPYRNIFFFTDGVLENSQRLIKRRDHEIAVAGLETFLNAIRINVNSEECCAGHGCSERLSSAHTTHSTANDELSGEVAAKMFFACGRERLEGALDYSLRSDINPRAGGHLAIHH